MADLPPGARPPDDDNVDVGARLAGAMVPAGAGHRPVTLSETLYERIVEVTRQEVSTAVEVLGSVVAQVGRLERRINALFELVDERAPTDGAPASGVAELREVVARIDRRVEESSVAAAGAAGRLNGLVAQLREEIGRQRDLEPLAQAIAELRQAVGAADAGALQRTVLEVRGAVEELRRAEPPDAGRLDARLAAIERSLDEVRMASGAPPDLAGLADTLAELRGAVDVIRSQIGEAGADLAPIHETLSDFRSQLGALDAGRETAVASVSERLDRLQSTVDEALGARLDGLREAVDRVRADVATGLAAPELAPVADRLADLGREVAELRVDVAATRPDLTPVTEALAALRAGFSDDLDGVLSAVDQARAAAATPDLSAVTDRLAELRADVVAARPDLTPLTEGLAALRAGFSEDLDGVLSAVDQARAAAATPDLSAVTDRLAELRAAVAGVTPDLGPVTERLDAIQQAVDEARAAAQPPDLSPVLDALDRLQVGVADARPDVAPLVERLDALQGAVAATHEAAATPPDLSAVAQAVADLRAAIADDHEGVVAQVELLMRPAAAVAGLADETRARLDALAEGQGQQAAVLDAVRQSVDDAPARVEEAARAGVEPLDARVAELSRVVDDLARQAVAVRTRVEGLDPAAGQAELLARLDALQGALAAANLPEQDGRLREVRTVLAALVSEVVSLRETGDTQAVATEVAAVAERLATEADTIRAALDRTRQETAARVSALQDLLTEVQGQVAGGGERMQGAVAELRAEVELVRGLREAVDGVAEGVAQAAAAAQAAATASELTKAVNVITEVRWDMESTQERVLDVDRKIGALRSDLADTARMAHAGYQAAEAVAAGLSAVARLERRLDVELDGMGRQLDALAAAVELSVQARAERDRARDTTADRLASQVVDRVRRYRELAGDVREAVREDMRRRRMLKERQQQGPAGPAELTPSSPEGDGQPR